MFVTLEDHSAVEADQRLISGRLVGEEGGYGP